MKTISILAFLFAFSLIISAHEEPSKTMFEKMQKEKNMKRISNSKIKKATTWKYEVIDGKITDTKSIAIVQEYNKAGALTAIEAYKNDSPELRVEYSLDDKSNILTDTDFSPEGKILEKNVYKYDDEGRLMSGIWFDENNMQQEGFVIEKSSDKKTIFFIKYKSGDSIDYKLEYKYGDDYDRSDYLEANKYDRDKNILMHVEKKYNQYGLAVEKSIFGSDMGLMYSFFYEYDNNGNVVKMSKKLADGTIEWQDEYINDKSGNCLEINSFDAAGLLQSNIKYVYEYFEK